MTFKDQLIDFQNRAEQNFKASKSISSTMQFIIALVVFFFSTLVAGLTWPIRAMAGIFTKHKPKAGLHYVCEENFDDLLQHEETLLLDFWAEWCGPCLLMNDAIQEFAKSSKVTVAKMNADRNQKIMKRYRIKGLPQFLLIKNGKEIKRHAGPMTLCDLYEFCEK